MKRPEQQIHQAIVAHLRQRGVPGLVFFHVPNNVGIRGRRGAIQGAIAKSMGVRAGVSDIVALYESRFFALELKDDKGRPTEEQLRFHDDVRAAGGYVSIAYGVDAALRTLETWGLIRGVTA